MSEFALRCQCRKHAPTNLRCSRCNVPVCPSCSTYHTIGNLCKNCFKGNRDSNYKISTQSYVITFVAMLAASSLIGWVLAANAHFGFMLIIWGGLLHGMGVAEVGLRVSSRKRGEIVQAATGVAIGLGAFIGVWLVTMNSNSDSFIPVAADPYAALKNPLFWVRAAFSVVVGVGRIRTI